MQNTSKVSQEDFKTRNEKLYGLGKRQYKLEQYLKRICLDFSDIPNKIAQANLKNFVLRVLKEIDIKPLQFADCSIS